jgi:predicted DNA repair protein MutK
MSGMWRTASGEQLERGMPVVLRAAVYLGVAAVLLVGSWVAVGGRIG